MRYLPHTPDDVADMLRVIGVPDVDALFAAIPPDCRMEGDLDLPELTEWELNARMEALAGGPAASAKVYAGAGSYRHHVPAAIPYLVSRQEFSTSYTPYQPEISQGTLQAIFEYQTLTARLLGMEAANASMYDGASALAEALLMAIRIGKGQKRTVAVSGLVHPFYRQVVRTYLAPAGFAVTELDYGPDGGTDLSAIPALSDLAAVAIQSPNFFGCVEDLSAASRAAHDAGALLVAGFTEPLAYGLYKNPGSLGADIACGEGQSFGVSQSFGGPGLGMFATKNEFVRNMPGRLVGRTRDRAGRRGFVLTLATREQHIRREKATSNICSNQGLCATTAAMYLAALGGTGIRELARLNRDKALYLKQAFRSAGIHIPFGRPGFNEFVAEFPEGFRRTHDRLREKGIVAGLPLSDFYPEWQDGYLFCVTETFSREDLDALVKEVTS